MDTVNKNSFEILNKINVSDKVKEKIGLKYLSWADAWGILKTNFPSASMTIYTQDTDVNETVTETVDGTTKTITKHYVSQLPYFTDGKTCFVKVGVTINEVEYIELLPVMDNRNNAVSVALITMTAVNKAIQRAFVKACARHGLGLYIYAGEDLPDSEKKTIDFAAIENNCDRYQTLVLSDDGFNTMKTNVINAVQASYSKDVSTAIMNYVSKNNKGKRLSLFTNPEDSQALQRIYNFINEINKILAEPNAR